MITNCINGGIIVEEKADLKVALCVFQNCGYSIVFGYGKIKAEVSDCTLSDNIRDAIYIGSLCVGSISFDNIMRTNYETGIANASDARCCVTLNGDVLPTNTVQSESEKHAFYSKFLSATEKRSSQFLGIQRSVKAAGVLEHAPQCNKCNIKEPKDAKFLKCGRCEAVVYCSKDCQKNDWPVHKTVCTL
jgi:hypothetical protein